jgi:hypothetical protein
MAFAGVLTIMLVAFGIYGFRKYFHLRRKYSGLFARVDKLE